MDPTAPKKNPNSKVPKDPNQDPATSAQPQTTASPFEPPSKLDSDETKKPPSFIQPGQFVVSGDENEPILEPSSASTQNQPEPSSPPTTPPPPSPSYAPTQTTPSPPLPSGPHLASSKVSSNQPPPPPSEPLPSPLMGNNPKTAIPQDFPKSSLEPNQNQPSPTPFAAPPQGQTETENTSKIKILKKIAIVLGVLILITTIGGAAWFFILGNKSQNQPAKTQVDQQQIEEPPPLPKRTGNGFADLPFPTNEATGEATGQATNDSEETTQTQENL